MRFRSFLAWVPVAVLFAACGSDESDGDAAGKTTCAAGATQACTCNGNDTGVQVCAADGKSWGACNCGGSGGSGGGSGGAGGSGNAGGSGGTGNADGGSGGVAGNGFGGAGGSGGNDASAGGAPTGGTSGAGGQDGAAGGDAGIVWQDEPCANPNNPYAKSYMDCQGDCFLPAGKYMNCAQAKCTMAYSLSGDDVLPIRVRLPSKPGVDPNCVAQCGSASTTFGVGIAIGNGLQGAIKVTVAKPWKIAFHSQFGVPSHYCMDGSETTECAVHPSSGSKVLFLTDDPNAPAVNALIELTSDAGTCL